jgi:hypothetical protein
LPSSRQRKPDPRRDMFLNLSGQIEGQLRDAYDCQYSAGNATQASLGKKLGIGRSAVHRRLTGQTNMTTETIADMVWALDCAINVQIFDPSNVSDRRNFSFCMSKQPVPPLKVLQQPKSELPSELLELLKKNSAPIGT